MARFIDRLHSALTDLAKGWGLSGESESAVPSMFAEPDDILRAVTEALRGQYSVEEQIGAGGMALVFRARDLKHDRQVALKVLRPELASQVGRERFLQEIRLAAQLSHPHILPLHDSGVAGGLLYYMMPYVEGETLRQRLDREGRLTLEEAVDITRSVAGALDFAHRQGVVHRDIKPENIMVHDGVAMVTDFGISKVLSEVGGEQLTQAGTAMGTPAYMSPEQIFGEDNIDGRSDVYSLALVVFELLTGNRLFTGSSARAILGRRAAYPEPGLEFPWDVPNTVRDAVRAALAESPETRLPTGGAFADALTGAWRQSDGVTTPSAVPTQAGPESIAVLPFTNMSGDAENDYFSDGITEEIINALTQLDGVRVAARTSSFALKDAGVDVKEAGSRLGVGTVLEGTVRQAGNRLRITAQLINSSDGYQVWSDRYDREMDDVFAVQDEIANAIAGHLQVALGTGPVRTLVKPSTDDLDAYQLYLKGRHLWNRRDQAGLEEAVEYFQQAVDRDPTFALAYSGLADAFLLLGSYGMLPRGEAHEKAKAAAESALELDDTLAEAHTSRGQVMRYELQWEEEERAYRRAIELNPSYATAHQWYATLLASLGRMKEALQEVRRAEELDPLSHAIGLTAAIILDLSRDVDGALRQLKKTLALEPDFRSAIAISPGIYAQRGLFDEALAANERMAEKFGRETPPVLASRAAILALRGDREEAGALRDRAVANGLDAGFEGFVCAALGEFDCALAALDRAIEDRSWFAYQLKVHPMLDPMRGDPRFERLLERMRLV